MSKKQLSFFEGVSLLVGTNVGAGILSVSYASRKAGYLPLLFWMIVIGALSTITMLYIAELSLRTKKPLQLSGLAKKYLGYIGKWAMFLAMAVYAIGALVAYMAGSGDILNSLLGIDRIYASIIFFIPAALILWFGLKAIGRGEKVIITIMIAIIIILVSSTLINEKVNFSYLLDGNWQYMVPIFNIVVFIYSSQFIIPELARGLKDKSSLPSVVTVAMLITFLLIAIVPLSVIALNGLDNISPVATISWGNILGNWAIVIANLFGLLAMLTSYWGIGGSFVTMLQVDGYTKLSRGFIVLAVVVPPFIIAYSGLSSFINAIYISSVFSSIIFAILPIYMLSKSRKLNERIPEWTCNKLIDNNYIKLLIIALYTSSVLYAIISWFNLLPAGW